MFQSAELLADLLNDKDSHCSKISTGLNLLHTYRVSAILHCSHIMSAWMKISSDKNMCKRQYQYAIHFPQFLHPVM